ncbi:hypothetical protein L195_g064443 [Trifolium pratense]|uniref:Uncharacterized protein n=1 Tax=Trifolium pratense TaxID=57577 RepID=A0A2K3KT49_TRIPR|nr:hypothetical protein L195_g064443 [Trifolium pratense]
MRLAKARLTEYEMAGGQTITEISKGGKLRGEIGMRKNCCSGS